MKTIKQIADALGIDKQRVYRYVKKHHIIEAHRSASVMYYDEAVEARIIQGFSESTVSDEAHQSTSEPHQSASSDTVIQALIHQLEVKDKQIADLTETIKSLSQSINAAHHNELAETIIDGKEMLSAPAPKKVSLWQKIFRRQR